MIALVHYHLRIGGVRRVMEAQAQQLAAAEQPFIFLTGEKPKGDFKFPWKLVPGLNYDEICPNLKNACPDITLWHFHNPSLGKNPSLTHRIDQLAESGEQLLLQLHDFAEDGRPENFKRIDQRDRIYPIGPRIRYALINTRDLEILRQAGVPERWSRWIGNPVCAPANITRKPTSFPLLFYPVRCIRRKNPGEAVLLAAVAKKSGLRMEIAVALDADTPTQQAYLRPWKKLAQELALPIHFGVVGRDKAPGQTGTDYASWLAAATHALTTSVAEGFGMAFLEPTLLDTPLIGRDLPEITRDFSSQPCGFLYQSLLTDVATDLLSKAARPALEQHFAAYGHKLPDGAMDRFLNVAQGDFGRLPESLQERVVRRVVQGLEMPRARVSGREIPLDIWLARAIKIHEPLLAKSEVEARFGPKPYEQRLFQLYNELTLTKNQAPRKLSYASSEKIVQSFLHPENFCLLRHH